ncbi:SDR family NAD(P)-dependent oxidoreductase [Chloroflexi bacterium TSY]|nr:SDR family NAD(P)-dependent oxidoreductase [Chloroflexi bacterium TSY]
MRSLKNQVAVVTGATRGAGRGVACMLGEAGATVYCTGRSVKGSPSEIGRPETIEETAEMVTAHGGVGLWQQVDHTQPAQVKALFERVHQEQQGRLDILVNNISGNWHVEWVVQGYSAQPFWDCNLQKGLSVQETGVHSHIITNHYGAQLMVENRNGLIVEITDGNYVGYNGCGLFSSFSKVSTVLLAFIMSEELKSHNVAAVSLTPGWLRSEEILDGFGVTAENWRDALKKTPDFANSESPFYVGRAVVALATDPNIMERTGHALSAGYLAKEYGFTDIDGAQPPGYCPEGVFKNGNFVYIK